MLNPFLSEEDLLKRILLDFGVISREELKARNLTAVSKQELIDAINDFLLGLIPLKASAVLIIDEAQNLPLQVLEQIRILSNLETDKEKLLQIILVGQLELQTLLRSPELRQLDQRVSIRYELKPLDAETVAAYVAHRLTIAGGSASVAFTAKALAEVHRLSGGIPRLINLICDRALLGGFSLQTNRITDEIVRQAAASLDLRQPGSVPASMAQPAGVAGRGGRDRAVGIGPGRRRHDAALPAPRHQHAPGQHSCGGRSCRGPRFPGPPWSLCPLTPHSPSWRGPFPPPTTPGPRSRS